MTLRSRLTLWYSSILALTLLLCGLGLYYFLDYYIYNGVEQDLKNSAERAYSRIQPKLSLTLKGLVLDLELQDRDLYSTSTFLQLYNVNLDTVSKSANLQYYDVSLPISEQTITTLKSTESFFLREKVSEQSLMIYHLGIYGTDFEGTKQLLGVLQTAIPIQQFENFFFKLKYILLFIAFFTIAIAALLGWFLSRKALLPIEQVILSANLIQKSDDLNNRIIYEGPPHDEIGRLSHTINHMLSRIQRIYQELDEAYRAQRRFVSDASHELRTPLTTIRGNIELVGKIWNKENQIIEKEKLDLSREALQDIAGEAKRMSRLVNDLLVLARADAKVDFEKKIMEIKPIIEEVARKAHFLPRTVEWITGDFSKLERVIILGNSDYLQQLLFIFIENAFKYAAQGHVKMEAQVTEQQVGIYVTDTGIGMDELEIPHIFDRFYRADISRGKSSGTGLGLSIAKWIIDEHQGSIEVLTNKGKGSTFMIWLPIYFPPTEQ